MIHKILKFKLLFLTTVLALFVGGAGGYLMGAANTSKSPVTLNHKMTSNNGQANSNSNSLPSGTTSGNLPTAPSTANGSNNFTDSTTGAISNNTSNTGSTSTFSTSSTASSKI